MTKHGIAAINDLSAAMNKCAQLQMDHAKERQIMQQTIEEYKHECNAYQQRKDSMNREQNEMNIKLKEMRVQLHNASFLQQRLNEMRIELDAKVVENEKNAQLCASKEQMIHSLQSEIVSLEQQMQTQTD